MAPKTQTMIGTGTKRTVGLRARTATVDRPFEGTARRLATLDHAVFAGLLAAALALGYALLLVPAEVLLLLAGFALVVATVAALPFGVVRAVSAALARTD
jgi:hypothetical protein